MKFIAIIPARYASTRFPGKPLAILGGKPVIQRVYEQVSSVLEEVYVATDDDRIFQAVEAFGGRAVMTSDRHRSGTDRIQEAATTIGTDRATNHSFILRRLKLSAVASTTPPRRLPLWESPSRPSRP